MRIQEGDYSSSRSPYGFAPLKISQENHSDIIRFSIIGIQTGLDELARKIDEIAGKKICRKFPPIERGDRSFYELEARYGACFLAGIECLNSTSKGKCFDISQETYRPFLTSLVENYHLSPAHNESAESAYSANESLSFIDYSGALDLANQCKLEEKLSAAARWVNIAKDIYDRVQYPGSIDNSALNVACQASEPRTSFYDQFNVLDFFNGFTKIDSLKFFHFDDTALLLDIPTISKIECLPCTDYEESNLVEQMSAFLRSTEFIRQAVFHGPISPQKLSHIIEAMSCNNSIEELAFHSVDLGDDGVIDLLDNIGMRCRGDGKMPLLGLCFQNCKITNKGAEMILLFVKRHPKIDSLYMGGNTFNKEIDQEFKDIFSERANHKESATT